MFEKIIAALRSLFKGQLSTLEISTELDKLASETYERLDWRNSIVDLLKVLKLDSSLPAREKLADEFGYAGKQPVGTAEANKWLHSAVMSKIAASGFKL